MAEIERGFASLSASGGGEIAPFFRFPGLNDSGPLLNYLQDRGIASFTVDVVSDDSFISDADELVRVTMQRIIARQGGIVLFHDIKQATAKALPVILDQLKKRGFRIVHLRPSAHIEPDPAYAGEFAATAKVLQLRGAMAGEGVRPPLLPFYGAVLLERALDPDTVGRPVTRIAPEARDRSGAALRARKALSRKNEKTGRGKAGTSPPAASGSRPPATSSGGSSADSLSDIELPAHKPAALKGYAADEMLPPRPPYSAP